MLVATATLIRVADPERFAWVQTFFVIFGSLLVQALPFVLIGALAAAVIEVFVPVGALEKLANLPRPLQLPAAALAGIAFPICECGSVPIARRLIQKGLMPSAGITFMLAAPVLNPVVIASTFVAFRGRSSLWTMVIGRFTLGLLVAIAVGWVIGARSKDDLLRPRPDDERHEKHMLELGPPEARCRVASTPALDIIVMMGLAFVLSLCSESDAFIAASFVQFGPAAQLAFLVSGPMIDFKLSALYLGTFRKSVVRTLVIVVVATTFVGAMWVQVFFG